MGSPLEELLQRHVVDGVVPGAVGSIGQDEPEVAVAGVGAVGGPPLRTDAIMRIQSMTKAITSVAALRLVEAGRIELDSSVVPWLPELADRRVLRTPHSELDDTVPAERDLTLRDLLTCTSGYGMILADSPLQQAMERNGSEAGPDPVALGADPWLAALAELPLAFQPGTGWRYHHSFSILGVLISRIVGRSLTDHLTDDLCGPLGMPDTGSWVPKDQLERLPAAYRIESDALTEVEPAGGGFYAGPPPYDVSHGELVSTVADYHRFARAVHTNAEIEGRPMVSATHRSLMITDQVPASAKDPDSFFPGFWDQSGWGFGVGVDVVGPHVSRWAWSGGAGTTFFVDPDGTVAILLTQVEMGEAMFPVLADFGELRTPSA